MSYDCLRGLWLPLYEFVDQAYHEKMFLKTLFTSHRYQYSSENLDISNVFGNNSKNNKLVNSNIVPNIGV